MPNRIAMSELNASTVQILNTIRANASYQYQQLVPSVTNATEIPKVGEIIYGTPAIANEFINNLVNRIALVLTKSALFNNPWVELKKGYLGMGEVVEEVFVGLTRARLYDPEKAPEREFKRVLPRVKSAFHSMNWQVMYPTTIQRKDLERAFLSENGVVDLVEKIVQQLYTSANYDEYLLMKYQLIKAISAGEFKVVPFDATDAKKGAVAFRSTSNKLEFMSKEYNMAGVENVTPKNNQHIFMDSDYNATYDVDVLAGFFHMEKADFAGKLHLIDNWTSFDNERFDEIRATSDGLEEVTAAELALMADVKAVIIDDEWFQDYDVLTEFTEVQVTTGLYWNYNLHVWKIISHSPFSNAVVFVDDGASINVPASVDFTVQSIQQYDGGTIVTLVPDFDEGLASMSYQFVTTEDDVTDMVAVVPVGGFIVPDEITTLDENYMVLKFANATKNYIPTADVVIATLAVGDTISFEPET